MNFLKRLTKHPGVLGLIAPELVWLRRNRQKLNGSKVNENILKEGYCRLIIRKG
ncbi:hypothetical protein SAMN04489760_11637 [Syntrophus gentianae]|uniref:Uncharacterized protein n=1 Tax=Syntrophus gentianae TaxID=43775 RepID=A0A1H7YIN7_9BACT|nr:hypothetical protein [Syntrophus gentianae]SEM45167.1 hypothetical protein SAMN04489760_11637 [Syntrophus gentianae]